MQVIAQNSDLHGANNGTSAPLVVATVPSSDQVSLVAPAAQADGTSLEALLAQKTLSRNALRKIVSAEKGSPVREEHFIVQVVDSRKKEGENTNIKQRLMLSDGTSILIAMIVEKFDKIQVSASPYQALP